MMDYKQVDLDYLYDHLEEIYGIPDGMSILEAYKHFGLDPDAVLLDAQDAQCEAKHSSYL